MAPLEAEEQGAQQRHRLIDNGGTMEYTYDVIVLGSGSASYTVATTCREAGRRVAPGGSA